MNEQQIVTDVEQHKGIVMVVVAWIAHSQIIPKAWNKCVAIYPYCRDNGGVWGIVCTFFVGKKQEQKIKQNEKDNSTAGISQPM